MARKGFKITGKSTIFGKMINKQREKTQRLKALLATGIVILGIAGGIIVKKELVAEPNIGTVYVSTVDNTRDVKLYNEDGEVVDTFLGNDEIINPAISIKSGEDELEKSQVYVQDDEGNIVKGYMDTSDISQKNTTKIKGFFNEDEEVNIGIVSAPNGVFARQNKIVDKNTDDAELLPQGTYVLCGIPETSKDNSYTWRKIVYFKDGENAKIAYMVDEYLLDIEDLEQYRKLEVTYDFLNVRQNPTKDVDNKKYKLEQGDLVYVVPNIKGKVDEKNDWIFVAYRNRETDEIEFGWIAGADREYDEVYVEEVNESVEMPIVDSRIEMIVDTSSVDNVDLKYREAPGTDAKIKEKLQHGTRVYVMQSSFEQIKEVDGFKWIKIFLENGDSGYVALEYLKDKEISQEPELNNPQDTRIQMIVDTSSVDYADLKLREAPGTDAKIKMNLQDGTRVYTTQRFIDEANKSEKINGHKWIQVISESGETGYVAMDYIVEAEREVESGPRTVEYRKMKVPGKGTVDGALILDAQGLSIGDYEEIFKGNISIPGSYGYGEKIEGVMIKIGATGYAYDEFSIASGQNRINWARSLINLCEKYKIPYGTYYYTQAINEEETRKEIEYILGIFDGMGELEYNLLGLAVDVENSNNEEPCRMLRYARKSEENRQKLTELKIDMMEELIARTGQEVILYSDRHALKSIIDYTKLGPEVFERMWLVNHSDGGHVDDLEKMGVLEESSFWQVEVDEPFIKNKDMDLSIITKERFQELMKNGDIEIVFDDQARDSER